MRSRGLRAALLPVVLVVGAVAAAACRAPAPPPPPPPVHTLCAATATPGPGAQVALVAEGGTHPTVVKFQASTPTQVWTKVSELNLTGHVIAVGPDQPVHAQGVNPTNNPLYNASQPDFQAGAVDFPAAWPTEDGTGVRVAVIDTGVQADHPDLAANVTAGNDLVFGNAASNFARVDGNGHGTHVAGTIAAVDNTIGVVGGAPHSTIVPVRVLDCQGSGSTSTVASGIEWASDHAGGNVKVISMSLGGPGQDPVLQNAIQDALNRGVLVVSAAGNCGDSQCSDGPPNTSEYPGAYAGFAGFQNQGVMAVGSLDGTNHKSTFSNSNTYVTVAAPGENIESTLPFGGTQHFNASGYGTLSGTSMATPHVAAVAALIYERCPNDTPAQVEHRITAGVQALPSPAEFASSQVGLLRADAVVSGASCP